jgi:protein-S-isoprenylcysteine O-methyltransferase Ste14
MTRGRALLGSFAFLGLAPGTAAGLVPWWITRWEMRPPLAGVAAFRLLGAALAAVGAAAIVESFVRFAVRGLGTPAPVLPPRRLVVTGLYRHVRNPMYVGLVSVVVGQALLFGNATLLGYGLVLWIAFHLFVLVHEEPALVRKFGAEYDAFRANVPRWIPRLRGWRAPPAP